MPCSHGHPWGPHVLTPRTHHSPGGRGEAPARAGDGAGRRASPACVPCSREVQAARQGLETASESLPLFEHVPLRQDVSANTLNVSREQMPPGAPVFHLSSEEMPRGAGRRGRAVEGGTGVCSPGSRRAACTQRPAAAPGRGPRGCVLTARLALQARRHSCPWTMARGPLAGRAGLGPCARPAPRGGRLSPSQRGCPGRCSERGLEPNWVQAPALPPSAGQPETSDRPSLRPGSRTWGR